MTEEMRSRGVPFLSRCIAAIEDAMRFCFGRVGAAPRFAVFALTFFPTDLAAVFALVAARLAARAMTHSPQRQNSHANLIGQYDTIDRVEIADSSAAYSVASSFWAA
jgi:hypothetical protein